MTAHALRAAVSGPPFSFAQRLGSATCVLTLVLVFGPAMPLAWGLGALYFGVALLTQRWVRVRVRVRVRVKVRVRVRVRVSVRVRVRVRVGVRVGVRVRVTEPGASSS